MKEKRISRDRIPPFPIVDKLRSLIFGGKFHRNFPVHNQGVKLVILLFFGLSNPNELGNNPIYLCTSDSLLKNESLL
ncbi:hypothetical protein OROGR_033275 [Orobanche gracilis]